MEIPFAGKILAPGCLQLIIHEKFWTHWNLSALRPFYGLAASGSETEYTHLNFVYLYGNS
jgi:hypothetical protein